METALFQPKWHGNLSNHSIAGLDPPLDALSCCVCVVDISVNLGPAT